TSSLCTQIRTGNRSRTSRRAPVQRGSAIGTYCRWSRYSLRLRCVEATAPASAKQFAYSNPLSGGIAPGKPDRRPFAGILCGWHDGKSDHGTGKDQHSPCDLAAIGDAVQGEQKVATRDRR